MHLAYLVLTLVLLLAQLKVNVMSIQKTKNEDKHYDAIVIGAGLGGLSCALHLASEGMRVACFEQHRIVGGCCSSFRRKGFVFDAGAHILSDLHRTGLMNIILNLLGVKFHFKRFSPDDRFFINEYMYEMPDSLDEFKRDLCAKFGCDELKVNDFFKEIRSLLKANQSKSKYVDKSYEALLNAYFSDEKIKKILSAQWLYRGQTPAEFNAVDAATLFFSYWSGGSYYPMGGSQKFSDALRDKFIDLGGEIFLRTEVSEVEIDSGTVKGIRTSNGEYYTSSIVINNGSVTNLKKMINSDALSENVEQYIQNGKESVSLFTTYWGIKADETYVRDKCGWYFDKWDINDTGVMLITCPTLLDKNLAPEGCHIIETFSLAETEQIEYYKLNKSNEKNIVLEQLNNIFSGFEEKVVVSEASTPSTILRYTLNDKGSVYGWAPNLNQGGSKRMDDELGVSGLYQVGHWTKPGSGVAPVIVSGRVVARKILGYGGMF